MTIDRTEKALTSDRTVEFAHVANPGYPTQWRVSWLPDRPLTDDQAWAAMELAELLADPSVRYDPTRMARAIRCAGKLGLIVEQAMLMLAQRRTLHGSALSDVAPTASTAMPLRHGRRIM
ncbi:hypothetical protein [Nocardia sp. NPDC049526]|uniref:hypothetical protein n=1 Tax=Nocardia sp. NPDC049526 TaxID=3364316 RepID=UPI0037BA8CFE